MHAQRELRERRSAVDYAGQRSWRSAARCPVGAPCARCFCVRPSAESIRPQGGLLPLCAMTIRVETGGPVGSGFSRDALRHAEKLRRAGTTRRSAVDRPRAMPCRGECQPCHSPGGSAQRAIVGRTKSTTVSSQTGRGSRALGRLGNGDAVARNPGRHRRVARHHATGRTGAASNGSK